MYVRTSKGLGDNAKCPQFEPGEIKLILWSLDQGRDMSIKTRINNATDWVFYGRRHPERIKSDLSVIPLPPLESANSAEKKLIQEWLQIRDCFVKPSHRLWLKSQQEQKK